MKSIVIALLFAASFAAPVNAQDFLTRIKTLEDQNAKRDADIAALSGKIDALSAKVDKLQGVSSDPFSSNGNCVNGVCTVPAQSRTGGWPWAAPWVTSGSNQSGYTYTYPTYSYSPSYSAGYSYSSPVYSSGYTYSSDYSPSYGYTYQPMRAGIFRGSFRSRGVAACVGGN